MRHINYKEPDDSPENEWYKKWKQRAEEETRNAILAYEKGDPYEFKPNIWGDAKDYLKRMFNHKCAYCEAKFEHVSFGDVEHYRPKKKVEGDDKHVGYYWLAYHLKNLFPSCERCNRGGAKMNKFPVEGDAYVYGPDGNLDDEKPLLLNPYDDYPEEDLKFAPPIEEKPLGTVTHLSKRGEVSIRTYLLDREQLNEKRREAQHNVIQELDLALVRTKNVSPILSEIAQGEKEFSAALLVAADNWVSSLETQVKSYREARKRDDSSAQN